MTHDEMEQVLDEAFSKVVGGVRGLAFPPDVPNDYKRWTREEDVLLMTLHRKYNMNIKELARVFNRPELALLDRIISLENEQES